MVGVRAFLPAARAVAVLTPDGAVSPLRLAHPAGFWEGEVPGRRACPSPTGSASWTTRGRRDRDRGSVPLPAHPQPATTCTCSARAPTTASSSGSAPTRSATRAWTACASRCGRPTRGGSAWSATGTAGTGGRQPMRLHPGNGIWELFVPGVAAGRPLQVRDRRARGRAARAQDGPGGVRLRARRAAHRLRGRGPQRVHLGRRGVDGRAQAAQRAPPAHVGVRGASRLVAARPSPARCRATGSWPSSLADYVTEMGFTHVELLPDHRASLLRAPGATRPSATSRRPAATARPPTSWPSWTPSTAAASASSWTGCPRTSPRTRTGSPSSTAPTSTSTTTRSLRDHPDWGTRVFNFGRHEVANFLIANALFWLERYHIDGLRVDAVASMLYLDYSRKAGEWIPNEYGGRENLEALAFLRQLNEVVYGGHPGALHHRGGVHRVAAGVAAGLPGRPRLRLQVEHGLDARHRSSTCSTTRSTASTTTTSSPSGCSTRGRENFVLPLSHDEVVHGKGSLARKMPGDDWQRFANLRLLYALHVGLSGQEAPVHGRRVRPVRRVEPRPRARLAAARRRAVPPRRPAAREGPEPHLPQRAVALRGRLRVGRLPVDGLQRLGAERGDVLPLLPRTRSGCSCARATSPRWSRRGYRVGVPRPGYYREIVNSDAALYGGERRGQLRAASSSEPTPWHGQPHSVVLTLPPLAAVWLDPGLRRRRTMARRSRAPARAGPYPLGATWDGDGVNFALFSEHATAVELCLFDERDPGKEIRQVRLEQRTDQVWHVYVPGMRPGALYALPGQRPLRARARGIASTRPRRCSIPTRRRSRARSQWKDAVLRLPHRRPRRGRLARRARQRALRAQERGGGRRPSTGTATGRRAPAGAHRDLRGARQGLHQAPSRRAAGAARHLRGPRLRRAVLEHLTELGRDRGRAAARPPLGRPRSTWSIAGSPTTGATTRSASSPPTRATRPRAPGPAGGRVQGHGEARCTAPASR